MNKNTAKQLEVGHKIFELIHELDGHEAIALIIQLTGVVIGAVAKDEDTLLTILAETNRTIRGIAANTFMEGHR